MEGALPLELLRQVAPDCFGGGNPPWWVPSYRYPDFATFESGLLAHAAVEAVSRIAPVLYARVDCVTVDGQPRLMELEVIEPSLFLTFAEDSVADRLIAALTADARQ